ncbi:hypothetical protein [Halpernia sp.]|uniref:hypothetical protein n=1 Tax=Halpernia sp. TaxID=2782209 RepID=UPI003A94403A
MKKQEFYNILEWSFVIYIALNMCVYGGAKFLQFGEFLSFTKPLSEYDGMRIMWAFYAYSRSYAIILGVFEILGSILLFIPKTRILGCFVLSSILVNIILQDYFYQVSHGALANAILYQILIFILLWLNKSKLILAFKNLSIQTFIPKKERILVSILYFILTIITLYILQFLLNLLLNLLIK